MNSIDNYGTHCAYTKCNYREIYSLRATGENGAKFFRRLGACASRHIGAPHAFLNKRNLTYYILRTHESRNRK